MHVVPGGTRVLVLAFGSELVKEAMATEGLGLERSGWGWGAACRSAVVWLGWRGARASQKDRKRVPLSKKKG